MEQLRHLSEDQIITGFVASCVESLSEKEGCSPAQMWERWALRLASDRKEKPIVNV